MKIIKILSCLSIPVCVGMSTTFFSCSKKQNIEIIGNQVNKAIIGFQTDSPGAEYSVKFNQIPDNSDVRVGIVDKAPEAHDKIIVIGAPVSHAGWIDTKVEKNGSLSFSIGFENTPTESQTATFTILFEYYINGTIQYDYIDGFELQYEQPAFCTDSWETVIEWANKGYAALQNHYGVNSFLGLCRTLRINNSDHIVKVIGENEDSITTSGGLSTAPLTFETTKLLAVGGSSIQSQWDSTDNSDYRNSILRKNLNSTEENQAQWYDKNGKELDNKKSVFQMIKESEPNLASNIKNTNKKAFVKDSTNSYSTIEYQDKIFAPTCQEIEANMWGWPEEKDLGTPYKYYTRNVEINPYITVHCDFSGRSQAYWTSQANTCNNRGDEAMFMLSSSARSYEVTTKNYIDFAFCI